MARLDCELLNVLIRECLMSSCWWCGEDDDEWDEDSDIQEGDIVIWEEDEGSY